MLLSFILGQVREYSPSTVSLVLTVLSLLLWTRHAVCSQVNDAPSWVARLQLQIDSCTTFSTSIRIFKETRGIGLSGRFLWLCLCLTFVSLTYVS